MSSWTELLSLAVFLFVGMFVARLFISLMVEDLNRAKYSGRTVAHIRLLRLFTLVGIALILMIEAQLILWWWGP